MPALTQIGTSGIKDNAITTAKIVDSNVTSAKVADNAVTNAKVADNAVTTAKIVDGAVATADIADGAINNAKVNTNAAIVTSKISGLTQAIDGGLGRLENEVGLLNVNRLVDNSAVIDDFVKGFSDAFTDETGVNTGSNSNLLYNNTSDTYAATDNLAITQLGADTVHWQGNKSNWTFGFSNSDGNALGLESSEGSFGGNARTTIRTVNAISRASVTASGGDFLKIRANNKSSINGGVGIVHVDYASHIPGDTAGNYFAGGIFSNSSNHWFNGDPSTAGVKGAMLWFSSSIYAYNVKYQGNSGAVSYTAGSSGTEITLGLDNSTNRLYAKLDGTLNATLNNAWAGSDGSPIDGNFYIIANSSGEGNNLDLDFIKTEILNDAGQAANAVLASTFQSQARTATSVPTTVRLVLLGKEEVTQNLNTDTVFQVSRNNASNFSAVTMAESGTYNSSGVKIYTGTVDVSGQPSGNQLVLKITSALNKRFTIHGYSLLYK